MKIDLYYDNECPFCKYYASYIKLKEKHTLEIYNARDELERMDKFKQKGFDINNGFIVLIDDTTIIQGAEAIVFLNKLAQKKFFFYDNLFFKSFVYSSIKQFRRFVLWISFKKIDI